uniref:Uncharacterized XB5852327 n=1 Tax=Xenopus tropicalis TaxID=8364 RepID=A0A803JZ46_XENTR
MLLRSIADLLLAAVLLNLPLALSKQLYTTSYGGTCTSPCARENTEYYWCKQKGGNNKWWDYCSPEEGYDTNYRQCLSPCQRVQGSDHEQCFTDNGWSKCGRVVEEFESYYTSDNALCASECKRYGSYFTCTDTDGIVGKCSPLNNVTAKGVPCRIDHECGSYGYGYTWCYTDTSNNWEYCGKVIADCHPKRIKRAIEDDEEVCTVRDLGNRRELVLTAVTVPENNFRRPSIAQFSEASNLIATVTTGFCFPNNARTVTSSANIRLDMQGTHEHDGVRYLNVQLQLNQPRRGTPNSQDHSTTIAQILFPQDLDTTVFSRYIRRALITSMRSAYHRPPAKIKITMNRVERGYM